MNDLYICSTYYHLLIAIIKNIKIKEKNNLIIATNYNNNKLANDKKLIERVKKSKIFKEVIIFDFSKEQLKYISSNRVIFQIKQYLYFLKIYKKCDFNFSNFENIFMFNDLDIMGKIINRKKIKYYLIEDGLDCFEKNAYYSQKSKIYKLIKKILYGYSELGESKNIISIEVNSKEKLSNHAKNFIEYPKKKLFESLSQEGKKEIINIFLPNLNSKELKGASLLITQPLYIDNLLKTEKDQINIYKYITKKYLQDQKIIIKVHPRDTINYQKYFKNSIVLDTPFPIEILNFVEELKFKKVISISSTSTNFIENANEKVYLGWEWLKKFKSGELDEK